MNKMLSITWGVHYNISHEQAIYRKTKHNFEPSC